MEIAEIGSKDWKTESWPVDEMGDCEGAIWVGVMDNAMVAARAGRMGAYLAALLADLLELKSVDWKDGFEVEW